MNPALPSIIDPSAELTPGNYAETETQHLTKYLSFMLGGEQYALSAANINEVLRYSDITPVPGAPGFILGIINLRGDVVTVIDARAVFGLQPHLIAPQSRIIVVEIEDFIAGVLVDQVAAVIDLDASCIEAAPHTGEEASARFIQGVYNVDEALYILVDFAKLTELLPH